ncbi:MAG: hypothetical protein R2991_13125 [Thermoanaerobaculia bacterium]
MPPLTDPHGNARRSALLGLLFLSGVCSLTYEVLWFRYLRLVFGASTPATAVVTAIFMAGLGFGGLWWGRRADRHPNPLALYARLEIGIALSALASPWLVDLVRSVYGALGGTPALGLAGGRRCEWRSPPSCWASRPS